MMMAALRDSTNRVLRYRRSSGPLEAAAAITLPSAMRRWLAATGAFASVRDETNLVLRKGMAHAASLRPAPDGNCCCSSPRRCSAVQPGGIGRPGTAW